MLLCTDDLYVRGDRILLAQGSEFLPKGDELVSLFDKIKKFNILMHHKFGDLALLVENYFYSSSGERKNRAKLNSELNYKKLNFVF